MISSTLVCQISSIPSIVAVILLLSRHSKKTQLKNATVVLGDVAKAGVKPLLGKPVSAIASTMPNPYTGIDQASDYLWSMGIPRDERIKILRSFNPENIAVRQASAAEFGLRFYSNPARPGGSYLFETFPASRASLAIRPDWSSMTGFRQFQIRPGATILEGQAAPQGLYLPGSQTQKFILNWRKDLIP